MKIAHKDDYNIMQKRCEGASSSVAGASIRIMTSHFVAHFLQLSPLTMTNEFDNTWHTDHDHKMGYFM